MMNNLVLENVNLTDKSGQNLFDVSEELPQFNEMPEWGYVATAVTLLLIGFFGFTLNLLVIVLMCKDIQIWTPMNIILLNLVCSDFSVSIIGNPFTLASAINHGWLFGNTVCVAYGFFMSLLGITSITTLTVMSYERYCLVSCPFSTSHLTCKSAKYAIIFIWLYSLVVTAPPLFGWGKYINEAANISCSVNWESQEWNATSYIIFLFVFGLVVPVIVISYSYVNIVRTMRVNMIRSGRVNKVEGRVTLMIAIMIIAFLIAWTPYSIFALAEQFGDPELITPQLAVLPALIAKSSICYNPLIYVGMNSQFRAAFRRLRGKDSTQGAVANNETTVNQISDNSSSRGYIECTFASFEKKRKQKFRDIKASQNKDLVTLSEQKVLSVKKINNNNNDISKNKHIDRNNKKNNNSKLKNVRNNNLFKSPTLLNNEFNFPDQRSIMIECETESELKLFASEANIYKKTMHIQLCTASTFKSNIC